MKRVVCLLVCSLALLPVSAGAEPNVGSQMARALDLVMRGRAESAVALLAPLSSLPDLSSLQRGRVSALLGYAYEEDGRYIAAENSFAQAFRLLRSPGKPSDDYATVLDSYASLRMKMGDVKAAEKAWKESAGVYRSTGNHGRLAQVQTHLAGLDVATKKYGKARELLESARSESAAAGESAHALPEIESTSGWLASRTGKLREAIASYSAALGEYTRKYGEGNLVTAWAYLLLGRAQGADHDWTSATRNMNTGLEILKTAVGTSSVRYLEGELAYSKLLDAEGSHEEAARISAEANASLREMQRGDCTTCTVSVLALQRNLSR